MADLVANGFTDVVLATGGIGTGDESGSRPQAHRIRVARLSDGVPDSAILVEDKWTNTLENDQFGLRTLAALKVTFSSILFVCLSCHSGRCQRALFRWAPEVRLSCSTCHFEHRATVICSADWWIKPASRNQAYGEYLRIRKYSSTEDLDT